MCSYVKMMANTCVPFMLHPSNKHTYARMYIAGTYKYTYTTHIIKIKRIITYIERTCITRKRAHYVGSYQNPLRIYVLHDNAVATVMHTHITNATFAHRIYAHTNVRTYGQIAHRPHVINALPRVRPSRHSHYAQHIPTYTHILTFAHTHIHTFIQSCIPEYVHIKIYYISYVRT
jgi:hypothetical protein